MLETELKDETETHINSRRNGGEGHDVRRETFTGGVVHRTPEASKETKPAHRTLPDFIFYEKEVSDLSDRPWLTQRSRFLSAHKFPHWPPKRTYMRQSN
jgi:hypothetical protein